MYYIVYTFTCMEQIFINVHVRITIADAISSISIKITIDDKNNIMSTIHRFVSGEYFLAIIWLIVAIVNFISGVIRRKK